MNRRSVFLIALGLMLCPLNGQAAESPKDEIVAQQLNCVSRQLNHHHSAEVGWADICYSHDVPQESSRDSKVAAALESNSAEMDREHKAAKEALKRQSLGIKPAAAARDDSDFERPSRPSSYRTNPNISSESKNSFMGSLPPPKMHQWKIGPEIYYAKYEEPGLMHQKGFMYGFAGEYKYQPQPGDNLYFQAISFYKLQGQIAFGQFDYTSNGTGKMDDKDNITFDLRGLVGKDYDVDGVTVSPYAGFGFRYLRDESEGRQTTTGQYGYDRLSNYFYIPLGVDFQTRLGERSIIGLNFEYDILVYGRQTSYFGYLPGYEDVSNDQHHGFGLRVSMPFTHEMDGINLVFEPFFRYWNIDDSEVTEDSFGTFWIEPENKTTEAGAKLSVVW